jgi:hypothetical protein
MLIPQTARLRTINPTVNKPILPSGDTITPTILLNMDAPE